MDADTHRLVAHLTHHGWIEASHFVDGDVVMARAGLRNKSRVVLCPSGRSYFAKIPSDAHAEAHKTVRNEAEFYQAVADHAAFKPLRDLVPGYLDYDTQSRTLLFDLLPDAENINLFHMRGAFPERVGGMLAQALATCHSISASTVEDSRLSDLIARRVPWIFYFPTGQSWASVTVSDGNRQLLHAVQREPAIGRALAGLATNWKATTLIHADAKWENFVLSPVSAPMEAWNITLLDWELFDIGDPLWDVGGIFQSYLYCWVSGAQNSGKVGDPALLDAMRPSLQVFWNSYCDAVGFTRHERAQKLRETMTYAAARLIQMAYEMTVGQRAMTPVAAETAQLSANILKNPDQTIRLIMGVE